MTEEVLNLLKLLAEDDDFASEFENAKSIGEKYDLAKSKFESLQKDDFIKFTQEFQEEQSEINEKELSDVSGGVSKKNLVTKLAALAMLGTTFGSMSSTGLVLAEDPPERTETKSNRKNSFLM